MSADEAAAYLKTRLQRVWDALGNSYGPKWTSHDAEAVTVLMRYVTGEDSERRGFR